ncbi:YfiT family bacillithiol transferase [Neobacillus cucumis]|uniref:YfiT family bacillithiol transferase n=1 Tax=Neobacillus cucumis TaxID=1740721 RepID=UPI0028530C30|nr:bacillithiol transferase BstA [Neobacillus cucumis]MDR4948002.1 bacillithiol transferase BstA [Neobacillus cucumis]
MMDERYPIGKFEFNGELTNNVIKTWIKEIEELPGLLRAAVKNMNIEQLNTPYRSGGWTVRQVVHHLADSHMNAYIRFKLALTEENPVIKPYDEGKWAELPDIKLPINVSLDLLDSLHKRLVKLLNNVSPSDLKKTFIHPETGEVSVGKNIGLYAWHGRHHLAHITSISKRQEWSGWWEGVGGE